MFESNYFVDVNWMKRVGFDLDRFRKVKDGVYNARCPFCGDSDKSRSKARLFFYERKRQLFVQCKNCGYSRTFFNFVADFSPDQFDEYKRETLFDMLKQRQAPREDVPTKVPSTKPEFKKTIKKLDGCVPCIDLEKGHPAKEYLYERCFKDHHLKRLMYTDDFRSVAMALNPESAENLRENEPRIVIPFYTKDGEIELLQGRSLEKKPFLKYITIKTHDDVEKVYGRETIDPSKTVYVVEGPLDSMFVENCIATCDANLEGTDADVLIFDNQPRNEDVVKYMENALKNGRNVVIWPNSPDSKQDINDMIQSGISEKLLMSVIQKCTYRGLLGQIKMREWAKL